MGRKVVYDKRDFLVRLNLEGFGELIQEMDHLEAGALLLPGRMGMAGSWFQSAEDPDEASTLVVGLKLGTMVSHDPASKGIIPHSHRA